jgi:predicted aspartyl protease
VTTSVRYAADYEPPGPVLPLRLAAPQSRVGIGLVALIDTGADLTVIPDAVVRILDLPVVSQVRIAGITGASERADVLAVAIDLAGRRLLTEAVAFGGETLLGRDLLNQLVLRLDGPGKTLYVEAARTAGAVGRRERKGRR